MVNQQLVDYIKSQETRGYSSQQLYNYLVQQGYNPNEVKEAIDNSSVKQQISQSPQKSNIKKQVIIFLVIILFIALIVAGYFMYQKFSKSETNSQLADNDVQYDSKNISEGNEKVLNQNEENSLEIRTSVCNGFVNRNEIGGDNLTAGTIYGFSSVGADGKFKINISREGAQLSFVMEDEKLRATGISLASCDEDLTFDAKSTAKAAIFTTPGILSTDSEEAKNRLKMIEQLSCFNDFHSYLKNKLKINPLNDITHTSEYNSFLEDCIIEMYEKIQK